MPWLAFNLTIDNVFDRTDQETVDLYTSHDPLKRFHATPGYPITVVGGLTFRLGAKVR